ncbi:MAG: hypothetical protein ACREBR_03825 [bacterium]
MQTIPGFNQQARSLTFDDMQLHVEMQRGDIVDEGVSCDSTYMLNIMTRVGQEMRAKFHWVPLHEPLYLPLP